MTYPVSLFGRGYDALKGVLRKNNLAEPIHLQVRIFLHISWLPYQI